MKENNLGNNEEIKNWLKKISRFGFALPFQPLILAILHKRKEYNISDEEIIKALKEIERLLFLFLGFHHVKPRSKALVYITFKIVFIIKSLWIL